ncbi:MAG: hypothetical protein GY754_32025 [bacterium]|nr:hypothetical protein [bacterium]
MKKNTSLILIVAAIFSLAIFLNCKGGAKASPEMTGFMSMIQDKDGDLEKALIKYGVDSEKAGNITLDVAPYTYSTPTITKTEAKDKQTCHVINMKHGMANSNYEICWENKKITSFKEAK